MKNIISILNHVLDEIQPDKNYEKEIFSKLDSIIKKINQNQKGIKAILGGSGAKRTWLKTFDADIFALFDYKKYENKNDELPDILEKLLKKKFKKISRLHGSRDYFQIKDGNFTFEIVPILKINKSSEAKNITDVSPLHSRWVAKHSNLANEMRLTKQFCKAQNLYGAESHIRGFSGYVCEILTVNYGSFFNLIKNSAKWHDKVVVDVEKYYKGKDVFHIMNLSKLISPLIVIDPVQKDRNASAALSTEKFEQFKKSAKEFIRNPSKNFFAKKNLGNLMLSLKKKNMQLIGIKARPLEGKIDVVGSKLSKIYDFVLQEIDKKGFQLIKSDWDFKEEEANFYFLFGAKPLPKELKIEGPPISLANHVINFKKIHKNTFQKSGKIFAVEQRKFKSPWDLLKKLVNDGYMKERAKAIKLRFL